MPPTVSGIKIDLERNREENTVIDCMSLTFRRWKKGDKETKNPKLI